MTDPNQPMRALEIANEVRRRRSSLRRQCHALSRLAGMAMVADMLMTDEPAIRTMLVMDVLTWPRWAQKKRAAALMFEVGIRKGTIRVEDLTARQRQALIAKVRELAKGTEWVQQVTGRAA